VPPACRQTNRGQPSFGGKKSPNGSWATKVMPEHTRCLKLKARAFFITKKQLIPGGAADQGTI